MVSKSKITFIICSYNRADYLDDTLQSLRTHAQADQPITFLVIDNNSTDHTADVVNQHQSAQPDHGNPIRYIKETKQGLSHARNRGIKEAKAPYIVFLDDDIKATEQLIPAWLTFFENNPNAKAAGGKNHVQFDAPRPPWMSHFLLPLLAYHDLGNAIKKYPSGKYPVGCNMGFKKSIFEGVGDFDTDLGRIGKSLKAGEEKELFNRIRNAGHNIYYIPKAFLYHRAGTERLTISYTRKQALGLGKSMKLQLEEASKAEKIQNLLSEAGKLLASVPLAIYYLLLLNPAKATMLFKFRRWIWKGYNDL